MPLEILYCGTNTNAHIVAQKLVVVSTGDVSVRDTTCSDAPLQEDGKQVAILVYLNKDTFKDTDCLLCQSIVRSMDNHIPVTLVHENDANKGGCSFGEVMKQTPKQLMAKPYRIYSEDIAVNLYSIEEYQKISIHQLLSKMGAIPIATRIIADVIMKISTKVERNFQKVYEH